jgi:hypothetical protein
MLFLLRPSFRSGGTKKAPWEPLRQAGFPTALTLWGFELPQLLVFAIFIEAIRGPSLVGCQGWRRSPAKAEVASPMFLSCQKPYRAHTPLQMYLYVKQHDRLMAMTCSESTVANSSPAACSHPPAGNCGATSGMWHGWHKKAQREPLMQAGFPTALTLWGFELPQPLVFAIVVEAIRGPSLIGCQGWRRSPATAKCACPRFSSCLLAIKHARNHEQKRLPPSLRKTRDIRLCRSLHAKSHHS